MARTAALRFRLVWILAVGALAACSEQPGPDQEPAGEAPAAATGITVFSGARVIVGDGTVIENATFTVGSDNRFGLVGATAAVSVPAGATTIDLAGKSVVIRFGPGTFLPEQARVSSTVRSASVRTLEIRGAGMDATTLLAGGLTDFLRVSEGKSIDNLVVADLTFDGGILRFPSLVTPPAAASASAAGPAGPAQAGAPTLEKLRHRPFRYTVPYRQ